MNRAMLCLAFLICAVVTLISPRLAAEVIVDAFDKARRP